MSISSMLQCIRSVKSWRVLGFIGVIEVLTYWCVSRTLHIPLVFLIQLGNMVSLQILSISRKCFAAFFGCALVSYAIVFYFLTLNIWLSCVEFSAIGLGAVLVGGVRLIMLYYCNPFNK